MDDLDEGLAVSGNLLDSGCRKILYAEALFGATCSGGPRVTGVK